MAENRKNSPETLSDGTIVRSTIDEFTQDELTVCSKCERRNSPKREVCIYCGNTLGSTARVTPKPDVAAPEQWENGTNLIVRRSRSDAARINADLPLQKAETIVLEHLETENGPPGLPVIRTVKPDLASSRASELCTAGVNAFVLTDLELDLNRPPRRLRKIDLLGEQVVFEDFNTGFRTRASRDELILSVAGTLFSSKEETQSRKKRDDRPNVARTDSDRRVLDLYLKDDPIGFRVEIAGFDFSGLGPGRALTGSENFARLIERIHGIVPACRFDDNYESLRELLSEVWAEETEKDHQGLKQIGLSRLRRTVTTVTSNERQFTRYSRLQYFSL